MNATKSRESYSYSFKGDGAFTFKLEDVNASKRTIMGVGNTYKYMDSQLDVLMPGCAKRSIEAMGPESTGGPKIKHALFHDLTRLPGKMTMLEEREVNIKGQNMMCLCFESKLNNSQEGNETLEKYLDGTYDQHSIGFRYLKVKAFDPTAHGNSVEGKEWDEFKDEITNANEYESLAANTWDSRVLRVDEIKLFEISTVAFGANPLTPYTGNKSVSHDILRLHYNTRLKKLTEAFKNFVPSSDAKYDIECQISQLESIHDMIFDDEGIKKYVSDKFNARPKDINNDAKFMESLKSFKLDTK